MSDGMFWGDAPEDQPRESNAMRALREKAEADSKAIAELKDMVGTLTSELSAGKVKDVVTSKGYDPAVAALAQEAGVAASPEAVEAWLGKYGSVLAKVSQEPTTTPAGVQPPATTVVPQEEQAALSGMAAAAQGATPAVGLGTVEAQLQSAQSEADVLKALGLSG